MYFVHIHQYTYCIATFNIPGKLNELYLIPLTIYDKLLFAAQSLPSP